METTGKIKLVEWRNNSLCGHPSYWVVFEDGNGFTRKGYTAPNSPCADKCKRLSMQEFAFIEYHTTPKGKLIIDRILDKEEYQNRNK